LTILRVSLSQLGQFLPTISITLIHFLDMIANRSVDIYNSPYYLWFSMTMDERGLSGQPGFFFTIVKKLTKEKKCQPKNGIKQYYIIIGRV